MTSRAVTLRALRNFAFNTLYLQREKSIFIRWYQQFLCVWTGFFFLPRLPYMEELYARSYLRSSAPLWQLIGDPVLPLWVLSLLFVLLGVSLALFAAGRLMRPCHLMILFVLSVLFAQDIVMPRAYGVLAYLQWFMLLFAPYEQNRSPDSTFNTSLRWRTFFLRLQFTSVYVFTVIAKLASGPGWLTGETVYRILNSPRYGLWLISENGIPKDLCMFLSISTLCAEWFIGFGLWFGKTKKWAMLFCILMHTGMALTLRVSVLFHILMVGHLLLFLSEPTKKRPRETREEKSTTA